MAESSGKSSLEVRICSVERVLAERIAALDRHVNTQAVTQREALELARGQLEHRLEGLNELREEVLRDRSQFLSAEKFEAEAKVLELRVTAVEKAQARILGGAVVASVFAATVVGLIVSFVTG